MASVASASPSSSGAKRTVTSRVIPGQFQLAINVPEHREEQDHVLVFRTLERVLDQVRDVLSAGYGVNFTEAL